MPYRRRHVRRSWRPAGPRSPDRGPIAPRRPCPTTRSTPSRDCRYRARRCPDWRSSRDLRPLGTPLGTIRRARAIATIAARPIARGRAVASTISSAVTSAISDAVTAARSILSWTKHLLAVAAPEIHPIGGAGLQIAVTEALLNIRIVVSYALAMRRLCCQLFPMLFILL
jgi:hypothetical protein